MLFTLMKQQPGSIKWNGLGWNHTAQWLETDSTEWRRHSPHVLLLSEFGIVNSAPPVRRVCDLGYPAIFTCRLEDQKADYESLPMNPVGRAVSLTHSDN